MTADEDQSCGDEDLRAPFEIYLFIVHPFVAPDVITAALEMRPSHVHAVGARRATPRGQLLPGTYPDTRWRTKFTYDSHRIERCLSEVLDQLEQHSKFLLRIAAEGASAGVILRFPGSMHYGFNLGVATLERLVRMRINAGIEIFPDQVVDEDSWASEPPEWWRKKQSAR